MPSLRGGNGGNDAHYLLPVLLGVSRLSADREPKADCCVFLRNRALPTQAAELA